MHFFIYIDIYLPDFTSVSPFSIHSGWSSSRMMACRSSSGTQSELPSLFSSLHFCWPLPTVYETHTLTCTHVQTHVHPYRCAVFLCRSVEGESDKSYWPGAEGPGAEEGRGELCLVTRKKSTAVSPSTELGGLWFSTCQPDVAVLYDACLYQCVTIETPKVLNCFMFCFWTVRIIYSW